MPGELVLRGLRHISPKLLASRMIDLADSVALLRANREVLDLDYLNRWADSLEVVVKFAGVWKEAFPEPPG